MSKRRPKEFMRFIKNGKQYIPILLLFVLLIALPFGFQASQTVQQLISKASGTPANITINYRSSLGELKSNWDYFAQGGEESIDMIGPVKNTVKELKPKYIRIDHIYDHFDVVSRDGSGNLQFNFTQLDTVIDSITSTGALPFISLSYMPQAIAESDIVSAPKDWNDWKIVVERTIEHYSGKNQKNLSNVYYEVWNEPDLFGKWHYSGQKNYLTLYSYAAYGARDATNVNPFKFGGPATTQLYKNWITALGKHVTDNNLRFDFFSWHRYNLDPDIFVKDRRDLTEYLFFPFPKLIGAERIISEWGFDSDINGGYDTAFSAAHTVATIRKTLDGSEKLFAFELVDGPDPSKKEYWGRWGLITHPSFGAKRKPRHSAFIFLNQLKGERVFVSGEGTWVTAIATRDNGKLTILMSNYDRFGKNIESVPLKITNLPNGTYSLSRKRLGEATVSDEIEVTDNTFSAQVIMLQNAVTLLTFEQVNASNSATQR